MDQVRLNVNGQDVALPGGFDLGTNLNSVIKSETGFKGTKLACSEGGCGACAVQVTSYNVATGATERRSINSCLCPVGSVDGCVVTTSEGIGSCKQGFSQIQDRFAEYSASQCGFCTPGFVVATHQTLTKCQEKGQKPTEDILQKGLDGNLCRCTGYRPILDACKSLVSGVDMEDLGVRSCATPLRNIPAEQADFPEDLKQYVKEKAAAPAHPVPPKSTSKLYLAPKSLPELFELLSEYAKQPEEFRVIAGNTGAGVYHDWPLERVLIDIKTIPDLTKIKYSEDGKELVFGANVSQTRAIEELQKASQPEPFQRMAEHLLRIAGTHVRNAATLGGNIALGKLRDLESDVITVFMAAGASVQVICKTDSRWMPLEEVLDPGSDLKLGKEWVIAAIKLLVPQANETFWSHKLAQRFWNAHAMINMAVWMRKEQPSLASSVKARLGVKGFRDAANRIAEVRVVIGSPRAELQGAWQGQRAKAVEKALLGRALDVDALIQALQALPQDLHPTPTPGVTSDFVSGAAEGLLLTALAPHVAQTPSAQGNSALQKLLRVQSMGEPPFPVTRHTFPDYSTVAAPIALPVEKDRVRLQTSGEAVYVADVGVSTQELFAAPVESTCALSKLGKVDPAPALKLPGVVAFVGPDDIPKKGNPEVFGQILFAKDKVEYHGQPLGLIVAKSQVEAERGAQAVQVEYIADSNLGTPLLCIRDAIKADSYYSPPMDLVTTIGDAKTAMSEAQCTITDARYRLPSQQHFYMEPQGALVLPDEAGTFTVTSSTQCLDAVQKAVAETLGIPGTRSQQCVGALGADLAGKPHGQCLWQLPAQLPHTSWASKYGCHTTGMLTLGRTEINMLRQMSVRFGQRLTSSTASGRSETEIEYSVGFDANGVISALDCKVWCLAGAFMDLAWNDLYGVMTGLDMVYELPNLHVEGKMCRTNLMPRSIVRGPGFLNAVMIMEQVIEHVAGYLGLDATLVRERNFMRPKDLPAHPYPAPPLPEPSTSALKPVTKADDQNCNGKAQHLVAYSESNGTRHVSGGQELSEQGDRGGTGSLDQKRNGSTPDVVCGRFQFKELNGDKADAATVSAGRDFPVNQYTLPQVWDGVKRQVDYAAKQKEVEDFNKSHAWLKRGIAVTPTRFDCAPPPINAAVSVYADGSVTVTHGGIECGQGLSTKVKQMAAFALGQLLPEEQRPFPMDMIHINDTRTDIVPNAGPTWSSTSSEGCVAAIEQACAKICRRLQPHLQQKGSTWDTWQATVAEVQDGSGVAPASVMLSAYGFYDGTERDKDGRTTKGSKSAKPLKYTSFGAACSEVEIDLLTGEKTVLRSDLYFDCGRSLNPAVDIGQIEGAFIMGMGLCTMEEVLIDPKTGKLLSDSTWTYKIPTAADIPRNFNVTFLKDSPNIRSVMSSKASGEPSMMLSMSVLYALRRAVLAAKNSISEAATSCGAAAGSPALPQASEQGSATGSVCDGEESVNGKAGLRKDAGQTAENDVASTKDHTSTSCVIDEGAGGNPFFVLEAPVTTCHGKEAMGQFSIVDMLKAAANKTVESTAGLEYHSSGEWVVVH
ncbi:TPA: hypothetical protein ACH3X2_007614 [Trebouxia sp. C0005]